MQCRIRDLRCKEVINICDGQRLGFVEDMVFDLCKGKIEKLIIPGPCTIFGILGRDHEYIIDICDVKQVGSDVILVEVDREKVYFKCKV